MKKIILSLGLLFSLNSFAGSFVSVLDQHKLTIGTAGYAYYVTNSDDDLKSRAIKRAGAFALTTAQKSDLDLNEMARSAGAAALAEYGVEAINRVPYVGPAVDKVLDTVSCGYISDDQKRAVKVLAMQCLARSAIEAGCSASAKFRRPSNP